MKRNKTRGLFAQISLFFRRGEEKESGNLQPFLDLVSREPMNANAHLKMGEIYQKHGEQKKARSEYLKAAEIFCDSEQYNKGAAIYSKVLQQEPDLEFVNLKLVDVYRKMGFIGQAFNRYQGLYRTYDKAGRKDKSSELVRFMADLAPEKFTLSEVPQDFEKGKAGGGNGNNGGEDLTPPPEEEKISFVDLTSMLEAKNPIECRSASNLDIKEEGYGFENILGELNKTEEAENSYRDYHYQMGLVCKEMGLIDEAIKQFQTALEKEQRSAEAAKLLDQCLMEKSCEEENGQPVGLGMRAFQKPLPQM